MCYLSRVPPAKRTPPSRGQRPEPRSASRRKRERRRQEAMRSLSSPRRSRRLWIWNGVGAGVIAVAVIIIVLVTRGSGTSQAKASPTATPAVTVEATPLASVSTTLNGSAVDGIQCQSKEQLAYHIHAHLAIFVNGKSRSMPEGVGVAPPRREVSTDAGPYVEGGSCFYWLHTHTADGIIHVESPTESAYTLGQFFAGWGQPLNAMQVGPESGPVIAYVNGQRYTGDISAITLTAHELIQLDVGTDVAPQQFTFPPGL